MLIRGIIGLKYTDGGRMKLKIGSSVELLKDIHDKDFTYDLKKGMKGEINNIIEIPSQDLKLVVFCPDGQDEDNIRVYAINFDSVRVIKLK